MIAALLFACAAGRDPSWTLATDDTRMTLSVAENRPVVDDLRCVGDEHGWCARSPVPMIDRVWQDGRETPVQWRFVSGAVDRSELTLAFRCDDPKLEMRSMWRARKGRGPVETWFEISNRSAQALTVPQQESLSLGPLTPGAPADVWYVRRGAGNALTQGGTFQAPLKAGLNLDLVSDHHNPSSPVPWVDIQVGEARGLYAGWEFSALGRISVQDSSETAASLDIGLMPDSKTDVRPRETLTIPTAFVGCYRGDIDAGSQSLHRFVLEKLRPNPPKSFADPTTVCGIYLDAGAEHSTTESLLRTVEFARQIGLDSFLVDALWFPACGDWRWDPARFPTGSKPISDAIHAGKMKFGLWCAWDNGGVSSDPGALSVRGPVGHPDWFESNLPPDWQPGPFYGAVACMASPEAKAWALRKTQSIVGEGRVDFLKTDCHPMINNCVQTNHRHTHGTDVGYWSTLGVYDVWDQLRAKYPNLVLENCSGASYIKDFGVVKRCAYTAVTDTLSNLPDRAGIYDSTFVLPPSALMTYTYERGYGLPGDDPGSYLFRSGMMSAWDLAPTNSAHWTEEEKSAAKAAIRTYREWLRPILQRCEVHHILPRPDGKRWDGMFFWSPTLRQGTAYIFRPDSGDAAQTVRLKGLEPDTRYLVWSEDGAVAAMNRSGRQLMRDGLPIRLPSRYTSELVHLQTADGPKPKFWSTPGQVSLNPVTVGTGSGSPTNFAWRRTTGARCYRVLVSSSPDLSQPVLEKVVYEPTLCLPDLPLGRELYWRVEAVGWGGSSVSKVAAVHPRSEADG